MGDTAAQNQAIGAMVRQAMAPLGGTMGIAAMVMMLVQGDPPPSVAVRPDSVQREIDELRSEVEDLGEAHKDDNRTLVSRLDVVSTDLTRTREQLEVLRRDLDALEETYVTYVRDEVPATYRRIETAIGELRETR